MNRSILIITALLLLAAGFLILQRRGSAHNPSSEEIRPLLIDKSSLVGSWIGHGGENNSIEVKIDITNDIRIPIKGTADPLKEQMYDNFRSGLLSPTQGNVHISGLSDDCKSVSGVISGGTAEGDHVGWTGYAGRIGEDNGGSWEDTAHFTIAGNLTANDIKGELRVNSNSNDCKTDGVFPIILYLIKAPTARSSAQFEPKANSLPDPIAPHDSNDNSRITTARNEACPDADLVGIKGHPFSADEEVLWQSNDGKVNKDDHIHFVRDSEGNVYTSQAERDGDVFFTISGASKEWTKQWHQRDRTGLTYPFQSDNMSDARLISVKSLGAKRIEDLNVDGNITTCISRGQNQMTSESWSSSELFTYIDLLIKDEYHSEHRTFSNIKTEVQNSQILHPPTGMKFDSEPVE